MRCSKCGADVVEQAVYCHECGQRIESADELSPSGGGYAGEPAAGIDNVALGSAEASVSPEAGPMEQLQTTAESRQNGDEPEKEIWQGGYSSRAMIGAWAFSSAITIGLFVLMIWFQNRYVVWGGLAAILLLWLYQFAVMCYRKVNVRYKLTTLRFMHESGVLRRVTDRIETIDMTDITFEQTLLERLVGVGTIRITSSDRSHPELTMPGIEDVKQVSGKIDEIRCTERRRRGLRIDQI